jgi:hypothetical protein
MGLLDDLIYGYRVIRDAGASYVSRGTIAFIGATVTDDPGSDSTVVTIPSPAAISTLTAQDIATEATAGNTGAIADAGHKHRLPESVLRGVMGTITSSIAFNSQRLTGLASPSASTDAATKGSSESAATASATNEANLRTAAATLTAALDLGAQLVRSTGTPTLSSHLTTKTYVDTADAATLASAQSYADGIFAGRDWKQSCRLATAAALATCTYSNGASGVGATLTASANGALTVDGVAVAPNDRIVVKNQSAGEQNGFYFVYAAGSSSAPWALKRDTDADTAAKLTGGAAAFVVNGTTNAGCAFFLDTSDPITIGTTALVFGQLPDQTVAGTGLARSGNTLSVSYGTTSGTATQGNDSRLAPAPSAAGRILYDTGSTWAALAAGTSGQVLTSGGAGAPSWATGGWTVVYALDWTAQNSINIKSSGDGSFVFDGKTWTADGSANVGGLAVTNGTGLVFTGNNGGGANMLLPVSSVASDFAPGVRDIALLIQYAFTPSSGTTHTLIAGFLTDTSFTEYSVARINAASSAIQNLSVASNLVTDGTEVTSTSTLTDDVVGVVLPAGASSSLLVSGVYSAGFPALPAMRWRKRVPTGSFGTQWPSDAKLPNSWYAALRFYMSGSSGTPVATIKRVAFLCR